MKKQQPYFLVLCLALLLLAGGCSLTPPLTEQEKALVSTPPAPYLKATAYSEPLEQLGSMLEAYGYPSEPYVIQGRHVINKTACKNLPLDITDMIKTAVNKVSGNVYYTSFDPDYLIGEVQTGNPNIQRKLPVVVLEGAITECDENLDDQGVGIDADVMFGEGDSEVDVGAGASKEKGYSRIALDLHLIDYSTQMLIPRKQTALAVDVWSLSKSYNFGFQVHGSGLGLDGNRKITQGKHDAVRILVELSVMQLLGRLFEVPYWRCMPEAEIDPAVMRTIKNNFSQASQEAQISTVQALLQRYGYHVELTGILDDRTKASLRSYSVNTGSEIRPVINAELYGHLFINMPLKHQQLRTTNLAKSQEPGPTSSELTKADSAPIDLHTALIYTPRWSRSPLKLHSGGNLTSGDRYKFLIMPEQDCYLYIFQMDSSEKVSMLFPMDSFGEVRVNNRNPLKSNVAYTLPGQETSFILDKAQGAEKIYIFASNHPDPFLRTTGENLNRSTDIDEQARLKDKLVSYLKMKKVERSTTAGFKIKLGDNSQKDVEISTDKLRISNDKIYILDFDHL